MFKKLTDLFGKKNNGNAIRTSFFSIQGRKPSQEDSYFISEIKNGNQLIFVADGVGGHGHGDFASQLCVEVFQNSYLSIENFTDIPDFLRKTTLVVAALVLNKGYEQPEFQNCGTTISGFFVQNDKYFTVNVGDSRVYLHSKKEIKQLTKDHSKVREMLEQGLITEQEAANHPQRHIMTSAIGQSLSLLKIDIEGPIQLNVGEILLAVSDGVHDAIPDNELYNLINNNKEDKNLAQIIVEKAYANGGKDNITACIYWHR